MQARVRLGKGDRVRYNPPFADPYAGQVGIVKGFPVEEKDSQHRYWVQVTFDAEVKSEKERTQFLALRYVVLEEKRETMT